VYLEACLHFPWMGGLGFLFMLEALCVVLVYLEALSAFFLVYNTRTYKKKKKTDSDQEINLCFFCF
jgi:hypothetical protein